MNKGIFLIRNGLCVYFLYIDKTVVYIGHTYNLLNRLAGHILDKKFNRISQKLFDKKSDALKFERVAIALHQPKYNINGVTRIRAIREPRVARKMISIRLDENVLKHVKAQKEVKIKGFTEYVEVAIKERSKYKEKDIN